MVYLHGPLPCQHWTVTCHTRYVHLSHCQRRRYRDQRRYPLSLPRLARIRCSLHLTQSSASLNASTSAVYNQHLNTYATVRDHLIAFASRVLVFTAHSITLQAASLAQLTQATNQLTRATAVRHAPLFAHPSLFSPSSQPLQLLASQTCRHLAERLHSVANNIPVEDVQAAASHIAQCASNVFTVSAVPCPLFCVRC